MNKRLGFLVLLLLAAAEIQGSYINRSTTAAFNAGSPLPITRAVGSGIGSAGTIAAAALNVTTGNALAVFVANDSNVTTVSLADTAGNSFSQGTQCTRTTTQSGVWFWSINVTGNAADVVTATFGANRTRREITVFQFTGITAKDVEGGCATVASGNTITSTALTTTVANEIILAGVMSGSTANFYVPDPAASYTLGPNTSLSTSGTEYNLVNSIQTNFTVNMTYSLGTPSLITVLTLKAN